MHPNFLLFGAISLTLSAAPLKDPELQSYFAREVEKIEANCLVGIDSLAEWEERRGQLRRELFEMLSLDPLPERTDLKPVITGKLEREDIVVEKLHFQSRPGLYVTANFYLPKKIEKPLPAILYVCGHALVKSNGVSYGNKAGYQHHGAWFARNGYACLTIDTIQLGEIEGIHHGTHREGMWWWNSRGYTPAGVEAWNCIRALDYLETRPEVDKERFGVTGRSGGGAYSWWIAALDERIKVAAPVAGITDLHNHVVDGVVEGHCDCMFFVNTCRWDYPTVAALVAPRPLLLANSDKDSIFPLDGVYRTHSKVAAIYRLYNASTNFGLLITEGPHKDTQDLQLPVFRWFNRHLKHEDPVIEMAATKLFTPQELKVFEKIPEDQIVTRIQESFVPMAKPNQQENQNRREELAQLLRAKVFNGWPAKGPLRIETRETGNYQEVQFDSQEGVRLKMFVRDQPLRSSRTTLVITNQEPSAEDLANPQWGNVLLVVRGGTDENPKDRTSVQTRRRYMLVGQTLDGMRVWDIMRGLEVLHTLPNLNRLVLASASGRQAGNLLVAAFLFEGTRPYVFANHSADPKNQPDYLNYLRFTSMDEIRHFVDSAPR